MSKVTSEQAFGPVTSVLYDKLEIQQRIEQVENPYEEWVDDVFPRHPKTWEVFEEARQLFKDIV